LAKTRRVFEIAREMGVQSKAILEKCQAEGLEIKNHMSAVSLGLEATIRDWFSEQHTEGGGTAIETAERVDLTKVKAKPRARKAAKTEGPPTEEAPADAVAVADEDQVEVGTVVLEKDVEAKARGASAKARPKPKPPQPEEPAKIEPPVDEAEEQAPPPPEDEEPEAAPPEEEEAPAPIGPAGPKVSPAPAVLRGPKVIRTEEPEPVRPPRRGPSERPLSPAARTRTPSDVIPSTTPRGGRGAGSPAGREDETARSPRRKRGAAGGAPAGKRPNLQEAAWTKGIRREQDLIEREERLSHASGYLKRRRLQMKNSGGGQISEMPFQVGGKVEVVEPITIKDLSGATGIKGAEILKFLFNKGVMATINQTIDAESAEEVCLQYEIELVVKKERTAEVEVLEEMEARERLDEQPRPPVVAVLGHVDHGKTSLLDRIRRADVAAGEAGGITQHIGAFRATIRTSEGVEKTVVFLDTPGHQAFTNMRSRGANLADLVVVVVAADDGVMPQTIESINHASAAGVPIVVALNKIDLPQATDSNVQKIYGQLAEHELNPVEWGGSTEVMKVSAETGDGIPELIEVLDYQAELLELKADYAGTAYGRVIEAELDPGRGPIARVLVQEGQLNVGNFVVVGRAFGKVRSLRDDHGQNLKEAGPATPVEFSGLDMVPDAGDRLYVTASLKKAEEIAEQRREKDRKRELATQNRVSLDNVFAQMEAGETQDLNVVLKADVQGSVEVLRKALEEVSTDEVKVRVIHAAVGGITESDIDLARASNGVVIGFQVIANAQCRSAAEQGGVDVRLYRVIYDVIDDVKRALEGMLAPELREEVLGHAEVRQVFRVSKVGAVAGCHVTDGVVRRNALVRVTREGIVVEHDRTLDQLKRFKDDAKDVRAGMECGMKVNGYDDIHEGDVIECYLQKEVRPSLS